MFHVEQLAGIWQFRLFCIILLKIQTMQELLNEAKTILASAVQAPEVATIQHRDNLFFDIVSIIARLLPAIESIFHHVQASGAAPAVVLPLTSVDPSPVVSSTTSLPLLPTASQSTVAE
jgi:hypothetical protein